jgi:MFS family permease
MADPLNASALLGAAADSAALLDGIFKTPGVTEILTIVSMVVLAIGAVWLTYNFLAATVQSAWDGEFLGKRFHSVWAPIRLSIGFAALLPMFDGWCGMQIIIYQVAKMGAGAANIAVAGAAPKLAKNEIIPSSFDRTGMATQLFNTLLCRARVGILAQQSGELESAGGGGGTNWTEYYGIERCGGQPVVPAGDLQAAHTAATQTMIANLTPLAGRVAAGQEGRGPIVPATEVRATIIKAAETYETSISEAARSLASSKVSSLNAEQAKGSWLSFGFQSVKSAKAQTDLNSSAGAGAQLTANTNTSSAGQEAASYSGSLMESDGLTGAQASGEGGGSGEGAWAQIKKLKDNPALLLKMLFGNTKAAQITAGGGLVQSLAALGATLIGMGVAGITVILGALVAMSFLSALAAGAIPLALYVAGLAMSIIIPMILMGITLAVYVPMIPALFWTLGVVAWLLVVAECILLAPVWALAHLEAEGEGMGQRTEKGYAMLLDLLLRPLALVFGFAIATAVLNAAWSLFTAGVGGVLDVADTWSFIKFFMWMGMVFIVVTIAVQLVGTVYRKALDLPDQIVTWLGSSVASYMGDHSTKDPNDSLRGAGRGGGRPPSKGNQGGGDTPAPAPAAPAPAAPSGGGK